MDSWSPVEFDRVNRWVHVYVTGTVGCIKPGGGRRSQIVMLSWVKSLCMHCVRRCTACQGHPHTADQNRVWETQGRLSSPYSLHLSGRPADWTMAAGVSLPTIDSSTHPVNAIYEFNSIALFDLRFWDRRRNRFAQQHRILRNGNQWRKRLRKRLRKRSVWCTIVASRYSKRCVDDAAHPNRLL